MIIGLDFDGTVVEHDFPRIGPPVPGAIEWLKKWQEAGAKIVLWTMRSDGRDDGSNPLDDAVTYLRVNGIDLWGVNCNPEQKSWTTSPKQYCHLYVDDAAFGCPLVAGATLNRPMVDWSVVGPSVYRTLKGAMS